MDEHEQRERDLLDRVITAEVELARVREDLAVSRDTEHWLRLQLRVVRATRGVLVAPPDLPVLVPLPIPMQRALDEETRRRRREEEFRAQRSRPRRDPRR